MKRVISGILAMLVVLPALEITSGINGSSTPLALGGLKMIHNQAVTAGMNSTAFNASIAVSLCPNMSFMWFHVDLRDLRLC
jgi:hypothetical protein